MNKIIEKQLSLITEADMSHFDKETNTYFIPKKQELKVEEDGYYLIHCKETLYNNQVVKINWNNNSLPSNKYLLVSVTKILGKMIKVDSTGYDPEIKTDTGFHWTGWLPLQDIEILQKL